MKIFITVIMFLDSSICSDTFKMIYATQASFSIRIVFSTEVVEMNIPTLGLMTFLIGPLVTIYVLYCFRVVTTCYGILCQSKKPLEHAISATRPQEDGKQRKGHEVKEGRQCADGTAQVSPSIREIHTGYSRRQHKCRPLCEQGSLSTSHEKVHSSTAIVKLHV